MDFKSAFLNRRLKEDIYIYLCVCVWQEGGYITPNKEDLVFKLKKQFMVLNKVLMSGIT
jgi:hypothetical protein